MAAGRPHDDRYFARLDAAHAVPEHRPFGPELLTDRPVELLQDTSGGALVNFVVEGDHSRPTGTLAADASGEQDHSAQAGPLELPRRRGEGERPAGKSERQSQPPPYGG